MLNVLIVEDDSLIAELERDFLEPNNYVVRIAENGEEALKIMDEVKIDAILLDVMLPGDDGFSLCRKMREKTDVPILLSPPERKRSIKSAASASAQMTIS